MKTATMRLSAILAASLAITLLPSGAAWADDSRQTGFEDWEQDGDAYHYKLEVTSGGQWYGNNVHRFDDPTYTPPGGSGFWMGIRSFVGAYIETPPLTAGGVGSVDFTSRLRFDTHSGTVALQISTNDAPSEGDWETITNLVYDSSHANIAGPVQVNRPDARRVRFLRTVASPLDETSNRVLGEINFDNIDIGLVIPARVTLTTPTRLPAGATVANGGPVAVSTYAFPNATATIQSVNLLYRTLAAGLDNDWVNSSMTPAGGDLYTATIPPLAAGNVEYYVSCQYTGVLNESPVVSVTNGYEAVYPLGERRATDFEGWVFSGGTNFQRAIDGSADVWFGGLVHYDNDAAYAPAGGSNYWMGLRSCDEAYILSPPFEDGLGTIAFSSRLRDPGQDGTVAVQIATNATPDEGDWETFTNLLYDAGQPARAESLVVNRVDVRRVRLLRAAASSGDSSAEGIAGAINFDNLALLEIDLARVTLTNLTRNPPDANVANGGPVAIELDVLPTPGATVDAVDLIYRTLADGLDNNWKTNAMTKGGGAIYTGLIPPLAAGAVEFRVECRYSGILNESPVSTPIEGYTAVYPDGDRRATDFEGWKWEAGTDYFRTVAGSDDRWTSGDTHYDNTPDYAPPGGSNYWMGLRDIEGANILSPPFDGGVDSIDFTSALRDNSQSGTVDLQVATIDEPGESDWETVSSLVYSAGQPDNAGPVQLLRADVRRVRFLRTDASGADPIAGAINFDNIAISYLPSLVADVTLTNLTRNPADATIPGGIPVAITIEAIPNPSATIQAVNLIYRTLAAGAAPWWVTNAMTAAGDDLYEGEIPPLAAGDVEYAVECHYTGFMAATPVTTPTNSYTIAAVPGDRRYADFEGWLRDGPTGNTNYYRNVTNSSDRWYAHAAHYFEDPALKPPGGEGNWMGLRSIVGAYILSPPFEGGVGVIYFTSKLREYYQSGEVAVQVAAVDDPLENDWETVDLLVYSYTASSGPWQVQQTPPTTKSWAPSTSTIS